MKVMISMLNKNYQIHCKLNLTQNNITVNYAIKAVSHHLKNAMSGLFINEDDWNNEDKHSSNILIEREMREINRRTDAGCRWTDEGICKIIKLVEIKRHANDNYGQYFKQNRRPIIDLLQISLCS